MEEKLTCNNKRGLFHCSSSIKSDTIIGLININKPYKHSLSLLYVYLHWQRQYLKLPSLGKVNRKVLLGWSSVLGQLWGQDKHTDENIIQFMIYDLQAQLYFSRSHTGQSLFWTFGTPLLGLAVCRSTRSFDRTMEAILRRRRGGGMNEQIEVVSDTGKWVP